MELSSLCGCLRLKGRVSFCFNLHYIIFVTHIRYTCSLHISVTPHSSRESFDIHSLHLGVCQRRYEEIDPLFPRLLVGFNSAFLLGFSVGNLLEEEKINRIFNFMWEGMWVEGFIEVVLSFIVIIT